MRQRGDPERARIIARSATQTHALARTLFADTARAVQWRRLAVVVALAFGVAGLRLPLESLIPQFSVRKDFLQEYLLARAIADGINPYTSIAVLAERYLGPMPQAVFPHPTPHPPTVGLLFLPLSLLNYYWAAALWLVLEMGCLVVAVRLLSQPVGSRLSWPISLALAIMLLAWYPFSYELLFGQMMIPMLALLAGAWTSLRADRELIGGGLIGAALLLKPVPWPVLLVLVFSRRWRAVCAGTAVVLVGYGVATAVVGLHVVMDYFQRVVPLVSAAYRGATWNFALSSVVWKVFSGTGCSVIVGLEAPPLIEAPRLAPVLSTALVGLVLVAASLWLWPGRRLDVAFTIVTALSILVAPICWSHYLVLLALPMAVVLRWLSDHQWPSRETNMVILLTMVLWLDWGSLVDLFVGARGSPSRAVHIPFPMSMLTQVPALCVVAVILLLARLADRSGDLSSDELVECDAGQPLAQPRL